VDALRVLSPGALTLVEDAGRRGYGHLGIPRAGAFDTDAWTLANRLVGNDERAAGLEALGAGLHLLSLRPQTVAVTGAVGPVTVDGRVHRTGGPLHLRAGERLLLEPPEAGIRYYLAVSGGIGVPEVLNSRSYDTLGRIGPPPLRAGDVLPATPRPPRHPGVDHVPARAPRDVFGLVPGPDADDRALEQLLAHSWDLDPLSDRIGVRLSGPRLPELTPVPSKPMVLGALQVPPNGLPIILGPDHPTTGGYPVIAVVTRAGMSAVAQWAGGTRQFRMV
jgi:biotin-dependent carboxylase-like uncharacterized protein